MKSWDGLLGFHFSVLISAAHQSQPTFCHLNQGGSIIYGDLLSFLKLCEQVLELFCENICVFSVMCM